MRVILILNLLMSLIGFVLAGDTDKYKVQKEAVYDFEISPKITSEGDRFEINFTTKGFCDVTICVENSNGEIIRHLASGVLGKNVPAPFTKDSKQQKIIWDSKNDLGEYVKDVGSCKIKVSLGLQPQFEKNMLSVPQRRIPSWKGQKPFSCLPIPLMCPTKEGVYVYDGSAVDMIRLFDHAGNYVKTIYPFAAKDVADVKGVQLKTFIQDGKKSPLKIGFTETTLLTSGASSNSSHYSVSMFGCAATALAVSNNSIAITLNNLNRIGLNENLKKLELNGPKVTYPLSIPERGNRKPSIEQISPISLAFSPDGKTLYMSGYEIRDYRNTGGDFYLGGCLHGVAKKNFESNEPPTLFLGSMDGNGYGKDDYHFTDATSVACDSAGRVYVSDYMNDRVQIYTPEGKFLKSLAVTKPTKIDIHPKTNEIYIYSWLLKHDYTLGVLSPELVINPALTVFSPFENAAKLFTCDLPPDAAKGKYSPNSIWGGLDFTMVLNPWSTKTTFWSVAQKSYKSHGSISQYSNIVIYELQNNKFVIIKDFEDAVKEKIGKFTFAEYSRQRLYVNPKTGFLYVAEQNVAARNKAFHDLIEINPETTKNKIVQLPFDAEDMAFGYGGMVYLRDATSIGAYDSINSLKEVPFNYGEERFNVTTETSANARKANLVSGITLYNGTGWHKGGMNVSPKGRIAISCFVTKGDGVADISVDANKLLKETDGGMRGRKSLPIFYPGRIYFGEILIYDENGKLVNSDAVSGLADIYGVSIDNEDNIYVLASPTTALNNKKLFSEVTGTLMKFKPGKGKVILGWDTPCMPIKLADTHKPQRDADLIRKEGFGWVEGSEWMYGGVGFCGKNSSNSGGGCSCYNTRFQIDYFNRSFVPEIDRCNVAVLDSNGNLILRVGQYGNTDDGVPLELGNKPKKDYTSIGGDEVSLFYAPYVAVHSNRRLFIADPGNQRIISVKLNYHQEAVFPLGNITKTKN